ncbi:hypothetical protein KC19_12G065600 [Ceratodon purpureus]|uniref:Uncharacterized protein n=1 Tax=Ceratodon purpureus TaxID=3225 RepID=A0A8T0G6Q3_CERPU|nr:hypothetical protein KC19_12G065600 [Ceratodon purpureus]
MSTTELSKRIPHTHSKQITRNSTTPAPNTTSYRLLKQCFKLTPQPHHNQTPNKTKLGQTECKQKIKLHPYRSDTKLDQTKQSCKLTRVHYLSNRATFQTPKTTTPTSTQDGK